MGWGDSLRQRLTFFVSVRPGQDHDEVDNHADEEYSAGKQINNSENHVTRIETVDAEAAKEEA